MTSNEFALKILYIDCSKCPIQDFCKNSKTFSCMSTAKRYYRIVKLRKGSIKNGV